MLVGKRDNFDASLGGPPLGDCKGKKHPKFRAIFDLDSNCPNQCKENQKNSNNSCHVWRKSC